MAGSAEIKSGELWFEGRVLPPARAGLKALSGTVKQAAGLLMGEPL